MVNQLIPWLVWILPIAGALLTPGFARIHSKIRDYFAVGFSFASVLLAGSMLPSAFAGEINHFQLDWIPSLNIKAGVLADPLSIFMANVVGWVSFLIMVYSLGYMKEESGLTRYWFLMNFFIGNMQLIVLSDNFLQLFFGWEGVGFCSYALIGFWHTDELKYWVGTPGKVAWGVPQAYSPTHAGMKAFITTRIGDIAFLIGLLILFSFSGTFDFTSLATKTTWASNLASVGLFVPVALLIFGGAIGKSAQFPLHEWLPDAMAGPTSVSALIHAATMVKAGVFLVARVGPLFYAAAIAVQQIVPLFATIAWIGVFTAFLAATQAMVSKEVKKVLAYSTVSQIGYMMLGLGAAGLAVDFSSGYSASLFHLSSHAIFKAALFMGAGALIHATQTKYMHEMGGLRKSMKITFGAMLIAAASLSGIPPFSGFWSKDAILTSTLLASGYPLSGALFLLAVVTALITAFYSFRLIGMVFFGKKSENLENLEREGHHVHEAPAVMWIPYAILAAATIVIGIASPLFFEDKLRVTLGEFLEHSFKIPFTQAVATTPALISAISSIIALSAGAGLGYYIYIARRIEPSVILQRSTLLTSVYRFFENRWYINSLYYKLFAYVTAAFSRILFSILEVGVIDRFNSVFADASVSFATLSDKFDLGIIDRLINGISKYGQKFSLVVRRIQTGIAQYYLLAMGVGVIALVVFMILVL